jgi:hypothetical protein
MKVYLKEMRESNICLKILNLKYGKDQVQYNSALIECQELIAIFATSVKTAQSNLAT